MRQKGKQQDGKGAAEADAGVDLEAMGVEEIVDDDDGDHGAEADDDGVEGVAHPDKAGDEDDDAAEDGDEDASGPDKGLLELPKRICFVCKHLMHGIPDSVTVRRKKGSEIRDVDIRPFQREYPCVNDPECPANSVAIRFSPFTPTRIRGVAESMAQGDLEPARALKAEALEISTEKHDEVWGALWNHLQEMVVESM